MRVGTVGIDGKKHMLCFSVRVVRACTERYGSMSGLYDALSSDDSVRALDESLWVLSEMMSAGDKYAKQRELKNEQPLTLDELYDCCDVSDFVNIRSAIVVTISNGRKTNVEAESSPNAEATPGN